MGLIVTPYVDSNALTTDDRYWKKQAIENAWQFFSLLSEIDETCGGTIQLKNFLLLKPLINGGWGKS